MSTLGYYCMAGFRIRLESRYESVRRLLEEYRVSEADPRYDISVSVTDQDIGFERKKASEGHFSDGYLEELAVCRKIAEQIPIFEALLLHGSALSYEGEGCVFAAPSGTGKSTHARLWRKCFQEKVVMINDDKPFLRLTPDGVLVCGSPWRGKHKLGTNMEAPLRAIGFIRRHDENMAREISLKEAYPRLLRQIYRPYDPFSLAKTLELTQKIASRVRFYEIACNQEEEAAKKAAEMIFGTHGERL